MVLLHKKFTDAQIKEMVIRYLNKEFIVFIRNKKVYLLGSCSTTHMSLTDRDDAIVEERCCKSSTFGKKGSYGRV
ncbi:MAG: hypothetical protein M1308_19165 [Actinobacteria bacterium]|nr:hypothetical protein [Actinomycetota bacterium]